MAQPPGSEFGADFFKFVLGPSGDVLRQFTTQALPLPSGVPQIMSPLPTTMPQIGVPGLTTPGGGTFGNQVPNGFVPSVNMPAPPLPMGGVATPGQASVLGLNQPKAPTKPVSDTPTYAPPRDNSVNNAGSYAPNVQRFTAEIKEASKVTGVPENVLAAIVHIECANCDPSTVRKDSGAAGIGQVVGGPVDPLQNLIAAGNLLREKQRIFGLDPNDWTSTAAAYFGAYRPNVGVTGDRDQTGTSGYDYVKRFQNALSIYPSTLGGPTTTPQAVKQGGVANARPTQFDPWLTKQEQLAACGPAVGAALAGISVREAVNKARDAQLWDVNTGMHGAGAESQFLTGLGVKNSYLSTVNVPTAAAWVQQGHPIVFSMGYVNDQRPGHYFLADDYNPQTGQWHVGQSGKDLAHGGEWMTLQQMSQMGPPDGMLEIEQ